MELLFGVLYLAFIWLSWPISLWLFGSLTVTVILVSIVDSSALDNHRAEFNDGEVSFANRLASAFRDLGFCISLGLLLVCLIQVLLQVIGPVSASTVRAYELQAVMIRDWLKDTLETSLLMVCFTLSACLLLILVWPHLSFVKWFTKLRTWGSRLCLVISIFTSFTFFYAESVSLFERDWVAQRRPDYEKAIKTIEKGRRELVAAAWISQSVRGLPKNQADSLRAILVYQGQHRDPSGASFHQINRLGSHVAEQAPKIPSPKTISYPRREQTTTEAVIQRVRNWLAPEWDKPFMGESPPVLLKDLAVCDKEAQEIQTSALEIRTALAESIQSALGMGLLSGTDDLLNAFLNTLVGTLVDQALSEIFPTNVQNYEAAGSWVDRNVLSAKSDQGNDSQPRWIWRLDSEKTSSLVASLTGHNLEVETHQGRSISSDRDRTSHTYGDNRDRVGSLGGRVGSPSPVTKGGGQAQNTTRGRSGVLHGR